MHQVTIAHKFDLDMCYVCARACMCGYRGQQETKFPLLPGNQSPVDIDFNE